MRKNNKFEIQKQKTNFLLLSLEKVIAFQRNSYTAKNV